ncbi:MAG: MFS transporter [Proteobacteria bacterium]|nr:MAG: MFS transporter [Pseudomonadota bacterium]PIE40205.1 MAG: MFS transporter [Gammaproteobacteria bacterium]
MASTPESPTQENPWLSGLKSILHRRVITMFAYGFAAGLPIILIFGTLSLWLQEAGVERSAITYFAWAGLGYSFKFLWAPIVDTLPLPFLHAAMGRRRSWLLFAQIGVIASIIGMAMTDPASGSIWMACFAVMLGFTSATQDIAIDAYRIESAGSELQAMMSSSYIAGYRVGMLVSGAGALFLAGYLGSTKEFYNYSAWQSTYFIMALCMGVGVLTTLIIKEPERNSGNRYDYPGSDYVRFFLVFVYSVAAFILVFYLTSDWAGELKEAWRSAYQLKEIDKGDLRLRYTGLAGLRLFAALAVMGILFYLSIAAGVACRVMVKNSYVSPVVDFFKRYGWQVALLILVFIGLYRISDIVMGAIAGVFYVDIGFTKEEIAIASKTFGLFMTLAGGFLGGILSVRYGVIRVLWLGAFLSAITNVLFAWLGSVQEPQITMLYGVIAADNLSGGIATAAFIAFLSALTNIRFTAVQYAIFSSLMTFFPKLLAGYSGTMSLEMGYYHFFIMTALIGVPVLFIIMLMQRVIHID